MRAKTRLQHKVVTANGRLLPQTKKQELWAFRQCISHYAYRTKNGGTTCMDCGYQWNESNKKVCRCPHCGARLEILDTKCRTFKDKAYYSTLATQDGLQVQRVFRKRLLNYILCIRFFIEVHSIVSASRFFHMPTYLRVVIECQSRFFPFFPAFSRNCPDYFLHTSGSSSFRSLSDLGAR